MDLLALVSDKGEVCVKRPGWKTTWKVRRGVDYSSIHNGCVHNLFHNKCTKNRI